MRLQEIGGASQSHRAGRAAQLRERHAPDVGAEAHQIDEVRIERGDHETGAGNGNDQIDFVRAQPGALQAFFRRFAPQLNGMFDVFLVGLHQRAGLDDVIDGENGVALVHLGVVDDAHHGFELALGNIEHAAHVILHLVARDGVRRQGRRGRGDRAVRGIRVVRRRRRSYPVCAQNFPCPAGPRGPALTPSKPLRCVKAQRTTRTPKLAVDCTSFLVRCDMVCRVVVVSVMARRVL